MSKAAAEHAELPEEVAFFMAQRIRSNVRELEGYSPSWRTRRSPVARLPEFRKRCATCGTPGAARHGGEHPEDGGGILQVRVPIFFERRNRSVTRPRQIAMGREELTRHSLPEIGDQFGGETIQLRCTPAGASSCCGRRIRGSGGLPEPAAHSYVLRKSHEHCLSKLWKKIARISFTGYEQPSAAFTTATHRANGTNTLIGDRFLELSGFGRRLIIITDLYISVHIDRNTDEGHDVRPRC